MRGEDLSPIQTLVLAYMSRGWRAVEIARKREVRTDGIEKILSEARQRLQARTTAQAVATAYERGMLPIDVDLEVKSR